MATYNVTLNLTQAGTSLFQDVASGDTVNITVNTVGGATWTLFNTSGVATASIFSGSSGAVCSITFTGSSTYIASFSASYTPPKTFEPVDISGSVQGNVTASSDTTPDQFTFTDQSNVNPSTEITSATITVSGINAASSVSVSGGTFSIAGGAYTTSGTVTNGQTVAVRHTSSSSFNTATNTTLTIGGVSDTFTSTTRSPDTTADAFSFTNTTGAALNSTQTSGTITVTGLEPNYPFTVTATGSAGAVVDAGGGGLSGTYATSKSVTSSGSGQISVSARVTASGSFGTNTSCTVSVGGQSATYTVTTLGADTTPDAFSFTTQSNVNPSTVIESNTISVSGLNTSTTISITGGEYSINGGGYTLLSGSVSNTDTVKVKHTSTSAFNTNTVTSLNIGGVVGTFTSTTRSPDTVPNAFSFTDATGALAGTLYTSNTITVTGLEPNYSIGVSCTGGQVDAGTSSLSGTFAASKTVTTSGTGTLVVATQIQSSSTSGASVNSTVTIGGVSDTYTVTTTTNNLPNIFTFNPVTSAALSTLQTSNTITVGGLGGPSVTVSITNGQFSKNGGAWTSPPTTSTAVDGDTFAVRHTSASTNSTNTDTQLVIGGRAGTFRSTTLAGAGGIYGMQIWDGAGNITLDTSDNTMKDIGMYSVGTITSNTTISSIPITDNTIALVTNNNGEGDTAIAPAIVTLSPTADTITVSGGQSGFNMSIRLMEF